MEQKSCSWSGADRDLLVHLDKTNPGALPMTLQMKRLVIVGRGASGKSTLAVRLGEILGLPVIELDKLFWQPGLVPTPRDQWAVVQQKLVKEEGWIMDGDLGPYDAVDIRLRAADTIIVLDFSLVRCAWRALRRPRQRADFRRGALTDRARGRPELME